MRSLVTRVLLKLSQKIMIYNRKLRAVCDNLRLLELYFHPVRTKAWPKGKAKACGRVTEGANVAHNFAG